ncbi:alanine racemase [Caminibacter pacificus]|uniref:Alanine racemase n=1 Tax=Caminibacter pacificus TaxID=1424653 RepID=A0AAJ4RD89_9BACT|nr:alanine racemase [Caminibacter pacificus]QCI28694.1 alanine racemase [Caminibacter pacificus]ROR40573.1 alanine racemase [Caminibacter pacificus]
MATLYINKQNLFKNLDKISSKNPNILAVIKDNAYGHGIFTISKLLKEYGIKKVCVRNNQEAELVKDLFEEILIFNPTTGRSFKNFSYAINSLTQLKKNRHPNIHLKIDTGMHRNGILISELDEALELIKEKEFNLIGVFSHFCCSEEVGCDTFIQYDKFLEIKKRVLKFCKQNSLNEPYFHIANSTAIFKLPDTLDYVRPGIAIYGGIEGFEPVMSLVAKAVSVRELDAKEGVGYNKTFISDEKIKITTVDVGYADGIPWFKNGCKLKNTQAIGKISMDYMSVIGEHKEVVVFDDIKEFVKNFDTITYEILVKMSPRIKRVVK